MSSGLSLAHASIAGEWVTEKGVVVAAASFALPGLLAARHYEIIFFS